MIGEKERRMATDKADKVNKSDGESGQVVIDRRPLTLVLLSVFRPQLVLVALVGLFAAGIQLEPPAGLTEGGWRVICVFGLSAILWVTALIPIAITGLSAIAFLPLLGIMETSQAYAYFGSRAVFFILGAFILGAALVGSGLSTRLTLVAFRRSGNSLRSMVLAVFGFTALLSCVMSEHAVAAMSFPIVVDIARTLSAEGGNRKAKRALFLAMAWGCVVGGTTTVLGGGRAPLAIGILEETTGQTISFLEYMRISIPLVIPMALFAVVFLGLETRGLRSSLKTAMRDLENRLFAMGKVSLREQLVGLVLVVTIGLWAFSGEELGLANIAILSTSTLFGLRLVSWADVEQNVNWGVILMYGGAISLGSAMADTGAAEWVTGKVFSGWTHSPQALLFALCVLTTVMTEFMSNSAVIAILMPPALSLAASHGISPWMATMCVVLPSNFAFMFPMATPATAMAFSSGTFSFREGVLRGLLLDLFGLLCMGILIVFLWPHV